MTAIVAQPGTWEPGSVVELRWPGGDQGQTRERRAGAGRARGDGSIELQLIDVPAGTQLRAVGTSADGTAKRMVVFAAG